MLRWRKTVGVPSSSTRKDSKLSGMGVLLTTLNEMVRAASFTPAA